EHRTFATGSGGPAGKTTPRTSKCPQLNGDLAVDLIDENVISSARETCFNVQLEQYCYQYNSNDTDAQKAVATALANLTKKYPDLANMTFDIPGSMSDVDGDDQRGTCANKLGKNENPNAV